MRSGGNMKNNLLRIFLAAAIAISAIISLSSCDMLPAELQDMLGGGGECQHTEVEWIIDTPASCKTIGFKHSECKSCGEVIESNVTIEKSDEHVLGEWEIEYESTCAIKGSKYQKCTLCKKKINTEEMPLLTSHSYVFGSCTGCKTVQPDSTGLVFASNGDGTAALTGVGSCKDTSLVIPERTPSGELVVSIGSAAFLNQSAITSVIVPETVTSAALDAFSGCSVAQARVPAAIVPSLKCQTLVELKVWGSGEIPAYAMESAPNLEKVSIAEGVTKIGDDAFSGCAKLYSVFMPSSLVEIGARAFARCTALEQVNLGTGVVVIGDYAFNNAKSIKRITIPASVKYIGINAFASFTAGSSVRKNISELTNVKFEVTEGWYATDDPAENSGSQIDSVTLSSSTLAATTVNETYTDCYLKRN